MDGLQYQRYAERTMNKSLTREELLANSVMGLCGEAGEVCDLMKKHLHQGHRLDIEHIQEELGDVMWYIAEVCTVCHINLNDVMHDNVQKLMKRYPKGFNVDASVNRKE